MSSTTDLRRMLGTTGIWSFRFDQLAPGEAADAAMEIERLGFSALWVPEVGATEAISLASHLLHHTYSLTIANGIARMGDRSAQAAAAAHLYLQRSSGGRHLMGLGLGGPLATQPDPVRRVTEYLDGFLAHWEQLGATEGPAWCLAAYAPRLTQLGGRHTGGVHTYLVDPAHTAATRQQLGVEPLLAVEMALVVTDDRDEARHVGRQHVARYLRSGPNRAKLQAMGFDEDELSGEGSERLIDHLVVFGAGGITERAIAHRQAGADHLALQVLGTNDLAEDMAAWSSLARLGL